MTGIQSISTACSCNPLCIERAKNTDTICSKCYATTYLKMRKNLKLALERNSELLSNAVIPTDELPIINASIFRFEAFGDLINDTHLVNFINIAKANPNTTFALWTKNAHILKSVFSNTDKPNNLNIILSSPFINKVATVPTELSNIIDKVFTVYDKAQNVDINCGSKDCLGCRLCYSKNNTTLISERLK